MFDHILAARLWSSYPLKPDFQSTEANETTVDLDEVDSADEETAEIVNKEYTEHEKDDKYPEGRPGSLLNRMISYGNSKTEKQIAQEAAEAEAARQARAKTAASQV